MKSDVEGPPSQHLTPADLDAAALVLVIPREGEASLWLGETRTEESVARALHQIADSCYPDGSHADVFEALRALCRGWDALSKGESTTTAAIREAVGDADASSPALPASGGSAYPRGMGDDHRSAETGRYVTDAEAAANPDTTVTEHRDQPAANLGLATTQELIDELAARARVAATIGESWPHYTTMKGH